MREKLAVRPGARVDLSRLDPGATPGVSGKSEKKRCDAEIAGIVPRLADLQYRLFAENRRALLVVLQGMDTSGKDGVIRHVFSGLNPQGCSVTSFKKPSEAEADRDFLWRIHEAVPGKGEIGVFNRAHYEDVLVVRVHEMVPRKVWEKRYEMINEFERYLRENHVVVVKCFLHISKDEQRERLQARLDDPAKNWKFSEADVEERKRWDDYQAAYADVLRRCSTEHAPWYAVPSDHKWYRNWAVARIMLETLEEMDPRTPRPAADLKKIKLV